MRLVARLSQIREIGFVVSQVVWLTPAELSERWNVPVGTLSQWRYRTRKSGSQVGPVFSQLGVSTPRYRLDDVEAYERSQEGMYVCA